MYLPAYIKDIHGIAFPPTPFERQLCYRDDLHQLYYWNGIGWVASGGVVLPHHLTHELGGTDQVMGTVPATPHALVHRDAAARAQIVNPAVAADIDNMGSRDAAILIETLARALADAMHAAITTPPTHGSSVAAAINTLIHRDAAGRAKIVNPAVAADIDNLGARDAAIAVEAAARAAADAAHAGSVVTHGVGTAEDIVVAGIQQSNFIMIPTAAGWTEVTHGAGVVDQEPMRSRVKITDVNAGDALAYTAAFGFNIGGNYGRINLDKHLYIIFNYAIYFSEANLIRRVQLKESGSLGILAENGIGFEVTNLAMVGESYNAARSTVSLGNLVEIADPVYKLVQVIIHLDPDTPAVNFYINGSLVDSITTSANIPSGIGSGSLYLNHSIYRAGGGQVNVNSIIMQSKMWQEF